METLASVGPDLLEVVKIDGAFEFFCVDEADGHHLAASIRAVQNLLGGVNAEPLETGVKA
jgi:hypothetical protein